MTSSSAIILLTERVNEIMMVEKFNQIKKTSCRSAEVQGHKLQLGSGSVGQLATEPGVLGCLLGDALVKHVHLRSGELRRR